MKKKIIKAIIVMLFLICLYYIFIYVFVYPFKTDGMSMFPTIAPNEIKFSNRWKIITKGELNREDIVVFEEPNNLYVSEEMYDASNVVAQYDNDKANLFSKKFVKRIIGIAGDHIQITEENELYLNGEKIGYANRNGYEEYMYVDLIVPENSVYVLGDNRRESVDSRSFGCIPINKIFSVLF